MFILAIILFSICAELVFCESLISGLQIEPPNAKYGKIEPFSTLSIHSGADEEENSGFLWEKSGLLEGDIVVYNPDKNVVLDLSLRWPNGTISFYIEDKHFKDEEIKTILTAIREFHTQTCLKLKPYEASDNNWVIITGNEQGCWSSVGMKGEGGQQLNVFSPNCVHKGVIQHELLHAAGFYHQQSASDRDEYVEILWKNIQEGHESNFNKYNESVVTDYDIEYDYESIMHYSSKAFSKNGNDTIVSKQKNITKLGQREGFTSKDILKLNQMYQESCHKTDKEEEGNTPNFDIIIWFKSLFR